MSTHSNIDILIDIFLSIQNYQFKWDENRMVEASNWKRNVRQAEKEICLQADCTSYCKSIETKINRINTI